VAVLSYKHSAYLRECLESILSQKVNFKYEIVVGEDCSNDGSAEILLEYKEKYPDVFVLLINEENLGAAKNSFNVRKICRGKYVANLEADDYWCDCNKLQKQVDFLEAHPDYSAVGSNSYSVDSDGSNKTLRMMKYEVDRDYTMKDYFKNGMVMHTNTFLARNNLPTSGERYEKVRFCVPVMGDVFRRCLMYDSGKIYCFPEPMLCHRLTPNQKTSFQSININKANEFTKMLLVIIENLTEYFNGKYDFTPIVCNRMANLLFENFNHNIRLDTKEYKEIYKSLSLKCRISIIMKFFKKFYVKIKRKTYRKFFSKGV
ncbi:MAG: glycosyltransferase, partial [Ruminococcus sp.]|nr:glycosyltransferase [Candidatus Copronaster equi]